MTTDEGLPASPAAFGDAPASTDRAVALQQHSWELQAAGQLDEACRAAYDALALIERVEGAHSPDVANLLNDLAELECDREDLDAHLVRHRAPIFLANWTVKCLS